MHKEVMEFLRETKRKFPNNFKNIKVAEFGSLNINGSPRELFENCNYVGIDWRHGKDVDIVSIGHNVELPEHSFDTVISCEMLEHDKHAPKSIWKMLKLLKKNGLLILTMAGEDRLKHEIECGIDNHYKNISPNDLLGWIELNFCKEFHCKYTGKDIYFLGIIR